MYASSGSTTRNNKLCAASKANEQRRREWHQNGTGILYVLKENIQRENIKTLLYKTTDVRWNGNFIYNVA